MAEDEGLLSPPMPLYTLHDNNKEVNHRQNENLQPPQTGTTLPFIWPPPDHLQCPPPFSEPVPPPPSEDLINREMKLDTVRWTEMGEHQGVMVYDSLAPPPHCNTKSVRGAVPSDKMMQWHLLEGPDDDTLIFESRFECGNLQSASKIEDSEYNLMLSLDINTDRHTQWFYFRVSNMLPYRRYKFNIQNLLKADSVYNLGMQPLVYSDQRAKEEGIGWYRGGEGTCYFKNQLIKAKAQNFWTLTFTVHTDFTSDTIYLAHCFPYRYTDLQCYLDRLGALPTQTCVRRRTLCQTLAGNDCDLLTITSPDGDHSKKKGIVVSARVHPGETNASWMMKGVMDFLSGSSAQAGVLCSNFIFKLVPMLNPDGVIVGNYRCSLAGGDLNRQYEDPKRELFPEVLALKQMTGHFMLGREIVLYVDLHGHSKKSNIFMYGVENPTDANLYMRERIIPTLLDRASPLFNLEDCSFDVGKGKEGCGRVVTRQKLGIINSYTMEASFMGADQGQFEGLHFNTGHFESMGHSLCEVILDLCDPEQTKIKNLHAELLRKYPIDMSKVVLKDEYSDDGTDSDDNLSLGQRCPLKATGSTSTQCATSALKARGGNVIGAKGKTPASMSRRREGGGDTDVPSDSGDEGLEAGRTSCVKGTTPHKRSGSKQQGAKGVKDGLGVAKEKQSVFGTVLSAKKSTRSVTKSTGKSGERGKAPGLDQKAEAVKSAGGSVPPLAKSNVRPILNAMARTGAADGSQKGAGACVVPSAKNGSKSGSSKRAHASSDEHKVVVVVKGTNVARRPSSSPVTHSQANPRCKSGSPIVAQRVPSAPPKISQTKSARSHHLGRKGPEVTKGPSSPSHGVHTGSSGLKTKRPSPKGAKVKTSLPKDPLGSPHATLSTIGTVGKAHSGVGRGRGQKGSN